MLYRPECVKCRSASRIMRSVFCPLNSKKWKFNVFICIHLIWICWFRFVVWGILQLDHNECNGISNHRRLDCLLNRLIKHRSKKTSKLRVIGLCEGNPPVTHTGPVTRKMFPFDDVIMRTEHRNGFVCLLICPSLWLSICPLSMQSRSFITIIVLWKACWKWHVFQNL